MKIRCILLFLSILALFNQIQAVIYGGGDIWRVLLISIGILFIFASRTLNKSPLFFYICGAFIIFFASAMTLAYHIRKRLPKKVLKYGIMLSVWMASTHLFLHIYKNFQAFLFCFVFLISLISIFICNLLGLKPPRTQTSKKISTWTLQAIGMLIIFCSDQYLIASAAVILSLLGAKNSPWSLIIKMRRYWYRKFPPKLRLLSSEEYYNEGIRETSIALENLRKYCVSSDCAQWEIILKLNDTKRFASFVGGSSHVNDDEVADYKTYVSSLNRSWTMTTNNSTSNSRNMDISDNDNAIDANEDDDCADYDNYSLLEELDLPDYGREQLLALLSLNDEIISIYSTMTTLIVERVATWLARNEDLFRV